MANLTDDQLIEIGKKEIARQVKQKEYDRIYLGRKKFEFEQYVKFCKENNFEMPEYPEDLQ